MNQITKEVYQAFSEISRLGLLDVTTKKQSKNGTRMYYDPVARVNYATYERGYVRRLIHNKREFHMYPVNPRIDAKREWVSHIEGEVVSYTIKGYQLVLDPVERLRLLARAARKYRYNPHVMEQSRQLELLRPAR